MYTLERTDLNSHSIGSHISTADCKQTLTLTHTQKTHSQAQRVVGVRHRPQHIRQRELTAAFACLDVVPVID